MAEHPPHASRYQKHFMAMSPLEAIECGLYYCVKNYRSTVENAILNEIEIISSNATRARNSWYIIDPPTGSADYDALDPDLLDSMEFDGTSSTLSRSDLILGQNFKISQPGVDGISSYIQSQLSFLNDRNSTVSRVNGYYIYSSGMAQVQYEPASVAALFQSRDLNETFLSIARSMSNKIREGSDDNVVQDGETGHMVSYYKIVWPWISLHCVIVILGTFFLLFTILESRHIGAPVWKTSALATLSRGFGVSYLLYGVEIKEYGTAS